MLGMIHIFKVCELCIKTVNTKVGVFGCLQLSLVVLSRL